MDVNAHEFILHFSDLCTKIECLLHNTIAEQGLNPSLVMHSSKMTRFEDVNYRLKYIDLLSFLTMHLSAMHKALGFLDELKGYFPCYFSSERTIN